MTKISIIIPTKNAAELLARTLESISSQTYKDLEVIIVDGASTDQSVSLIQEKFSDIVTCFVSNSDSGPYEAMNRGIDLLTYDSRYVSIMGAGDTYYERDTLDKVVSCLDDADVIFGPVEVRYPDARSNRILGCKAIADIAFGIPFNHQSSLAKTSMLRKFRFDTSFPIVADYKLLLQCYLAGYSFKQLSYPIASVVSGGLSDRNRGATQAEMFKASSAVIKDRSIAYIVRWACIVFWSFTKGLMKSLIGKRVTRLIHNANLRPQ